MLLRYRVIFLLMLLACLAVLIVGTIRADAVSTLFLPYLYRQTAPEEVRLVPYGDKGFDCTVTDIAHAGDDRLFVVAQNGRISVIDETGHVLDEPFLDLTWVPDACHEEANWELGMLGLAFHPNYSENGEFFVTFNDPNNYAITLARYTVSEDNPNVADPDSKKILISVEKSFDQYNRYGNHRAAVHNGGDINFGPDGYLYVGFGDGGPDPIRVANPTAGIPADPIPGDPHNNSQNLKVLLGKIIRIDVNNNGGGSPECGDAAYSIPSDNPFFGQGKCGEIWSYGWRNPWRFSFDSATGDMYVGDVGEWERDEIDLDPAGSAGGGNYGWHCLEGTFDHSDADHISGHCNKASFDPIAPIFDYKGAFEGGDIMSVNGGYVYHGRDLSGLSGHYIFGDFIDGDHIWRMRPDKLDQGMTKMKIVNKAELPGTQARSPQFSWTTFGEDVNGELYIGEWHSGGATYIYRIEDK